MKDKAKAFTLIELLVVVAELISMILAKANRSIFFILSPGLITNFVNFYYDLFWVNYKHY